MTAQYRVVVEPEDDPTFPKDWGWPEADAASYMEEYNNGAVDVVWARAQTREDESYDWYDTPFGLGDIHISSKDVVGIIEDGETGSSYLYEVAADLIAEAKAYDAKRVDSTD